MNEEEKLELALKIIEAEQKIKRDSKSVVEKASDTVVENVLMEICSPRGVARAAVPRIFKIGFRNILNFWKTFNRDPQ